MKEGETKMSFGQWFKTMGIKKYGIAILIALVIDYGTFFTDGGIQTAFSDPEIPPIIWVFGAIAFFGFHIGMTWHAITAFQKQR